jgi:hypothetical protein
MRSNDLSSSIDATAATMSVADSFVNNPMDNLGRPPRAPCCTPMPTTTSPTVSRALLESTPLIFGVVAFLVCAFVTPDRLDSDFLNAAVQIIPFLLLALALETRLLSLAERPARAVDEPETNTDRLLVAVIRFGRRVGAIYAVVMLIWAETAGLIALDSHGDHRWLGPYLLAAIVAGMVIVGTAALLPRR